MDLAGYNQLRQCREGWMIYNKHDTYLGKSLEVYGEYSDGEVDVFRKLIPKGGWVVEIGANIGAHTVAYANIVGETGVVIAFEPQRLLYQTLCGNMALNSLRYVYCRNEAVSDAPGEMNVPIVNPDRDFSFGSFNLEEFANSGDPTPVITLDSLKLQRCDFMKIDVEGMEPKVLEGGREFIKKLRPIIYVENDRAEHRNRLIQMIAAMDYKLYWHLPKLFNPDNFAGVAENIFGGIESCNMLCIPIGKGPEINGLEVIDPSRDYEFDETKPN